MHVPREEIGSPMLDQRIESSRILGVADDFSFLPFRASWKIVSGRRFEMIGERFVS